MLLQKTSALVLHGLRLSWAYPINFIGNYLAQLLTVVLYFFLDQMLIQAGVRVVEDGDYFTFILIGAGVNAYLAMVLNAFSVHIQEDMLNGRLESLLATSSLPLASLLGPALWVVVDSTVIILARFGVGALLGADFSSANWWGAGIILILSLACMVSYGAFSTAFLLVFKRGDPTNWLIRSISYVFSGTFFPITIFPPSLQIISFLLPFTYAIRGLRGALMHGRGLAESSADVLPLLIFALLLAPISVYALRFAIRHLKRTGSIGHY